MLPFSYVVLTKLCDLKKVVPRGFVWTELEITSAYNAWGGPLNDVAKHKQDDEFVCKSRMLSFGATMFSDVNRP